MRIPLQPSAGVSSRKKSKKKWAVCDIEAHRWTEFKIIGWYNGEEYEDFLRMDLFVDHIFSDSQEEDVIYAHFGGIYDFMFIIQQFIQLGGYAIEDMIPRGSGLLCFSVIQKESGRKISFRDSSAFLPFGLANLTKSFGVTYVKQDFDFEKWDGSVTKKLREYLEYDCIGLYECIERYYEWPLIKKAGPASTMASQALKVFRLFLKEPIYSLRPRVEEFVRKSYFGGRTEIFRPEYSGTKNLYCYDVNSLYPFVMKDNEFPTNFSRWSNSYDPNALGFYEATVEVPKDMYLPPLPCVHEFKNSSKLIFPTGRFSGVFSTIELEYARSLGVKIISTGRGALFKNGGHIFKNYIETLYDMRLEAKAKNDGVGDILTKLLMNSCYGRFGLNTDREKIVFDDAQIGFSPMADLIVERNGQPCRIRIGKEKSQIDNTFTNVAIAAWVTSLARIHMHKLMWDCKDELYYTDTDSVFTTKKMKTGDSLGMLKEEYRCKKAVFLLPKTYVADDVLGLKDDKGNDVFKKLAMKGFDKRKIQHFEYDDFFEALEGDLRHMRVVHDEKFAKFRTAAKKGNLTTLLPESQKQIKSAYDKRLVTRNGKKWDSRPLHIS